MKLRCASEAVTSAGVPESESSSSGVTVRRMAFSFFDFLPSAARELYQAICCLVRQTRPAICRNQRSKLAIGIPRFARDGKKTKSDLRQLFFQKLLVVEVGVISAARDQLFMGAQFHNAAAVQNGNAVGVAHGRNPVRDEEGGACLDALTQAAEKFWLGVGIYGG